MEYTEEQRQELRDSVIEMCDSMLEQYDWDKALEKYIEGL